MKTSGCRYGATELAHAPEAAKRVSHQSSVQFAAPLMLGG